MKIRRYIFRATITDDSNLKTDIGAIKEKINKKELYAISIHKYGNELFVYAETVSETIDMNELFKETKTQSWIRMFDIFHYADDMEIEEWISGRKQPIPMLRLVKLKPSKISSYIYHHYLYQESNAQPRHKHGIICINEDLLAMYTESPDEGCSVVPSLSAELPQDEEWQTLMNSHFVPLSDDTENWTCTQSIFSMYAS